MYKMNTNTLADTVRMQSLGNKWVVENSKMTMFELRKGLSPDNDSVFLIIYLVLSFLSAPVLTRNFVITSEQAKNRDGGFC